MAFDFKKEYKEFYMPKNKPEIVTVPKANYIAVRGKGNPNENDGAYQKAISILRFGLKQTQRFLSHIVSKTQQKCKRDLRLSLATIAKAILRL